LQYLKIISTAILFGVCTSCADDHAELTQDQENQKLKEQFSRIMNLAMNGSCTDSNGWAFTAIGSRPCGGPGSYIIYSTSIDTTKFLKEVESYTRARQAFNEKWPVSGPCNVPQTPTGVACLDGVPVLTY